MTTSQQKIIIAMCAGEASGDLLGAHLIEAIKRQYPQARFVGIGGSRMKEEGFESLFEQEKLAVRGYFEVLSNLPEILGMRSSLIDELKFIRPNVFIGIDLPDFNLHVAAKLKAAGIPTLHYVSPSIWAWKAERVHKIVKQVNQVLCLFPMEPKLYEDAGGKALFVGHPLAQILPMQSDKQSAREILKLDTQIPVIAILPGSRVSEIEYMAPLFFQAAKLLLRELPTAQFIVPYPTATIREMLQDLLSKDYFKHLPIRLQAAKTDLACSAADVVLVTSGTATLEVALCKRPMVISYKISPMTYALVRHKIKVPHVGLPNILLGKEVVPELLQNEATGENLAQAVLDWYRNPNKVTQLEMSFIRLHKMLLKNTDELAANAVLQEAGLLPQTDVAPIDISPTQHHFSQPENEQTLPEKPQFSEVGVIDDDGQVYAHHSHVPSVTHTLAHKSADMFQEVDDTPIVQPPKKQGFLARLFGKKQAAESESYAATPRLQHDNFDNLDDFEDFNPTKKKPKAVPSPDNPNRLILEVDDLPHADPVSSADLAPNLPNKNQQKQPNIFDKYRDPASASRSAAPAAQNAPKENIFSKYMNDDGTAKTAVAKKEPQNKGNIFDKYRQQNETVQAEKTPLTVQTASETKGSSIFDKYRQNQNKVVEESAENAIAETFAAPFDDSPEIELKQAAKPDSVQTAQSRPNIFARHRQQQPTEPKETLAPVLPDEPTQTPKVPTPEAAPANTEVARSRPNIFARHRNQQAATPKAVPPTPEVDLHAILGEVRTETVIAVPVEEDIVIPEISLNLNEEDFVVVHDPNTGKPTLLSKEELAEQHNQTIATAEPTPASEQIEPTAPTLLPTRTERILKPQRARPDEATQPILPKSSFAYKYAMIFQNTSDVHLDNEFVPNESMETFAPQAVAEQTQPEIVAPQVVTEQTQPEIVEPQIVTEQMQPEIVAPQIVVEQTQPEIVAPQIVAEQTQPEIVEPQVAVEQMQPEIVVPQIVTEQTQPEIVAPQIVAEQTQPEIVAPQVVTEQMQPEIVAPQVVVEQMQPEIVEPQVVVEQMQPEIVAPQVIVEQMQPEIVEPQVVVEQMQPEIVAPQIVTEQTQPEIVAPQIVTEQMQPEIIAPQVIVEQMQPEIVEPQVVVEQITQPEIVAPQIVTEQMQPEIVAPQIVTEQTQPEIVEPQVVVEQMQPEIIAPQVIVEQMQPEIVEPQVVAEQIQPEIVEPQVAVEQMQPEPQHETEHQSWATPDIAAHIVRSAAQPAVADDLFSAVLDAIGMPQAENTVSPEPLPEKISEPAPQPETPQTQEKVYQHNPRFSRRYPAKTGYTAANQRLFF